MLAALSVFDLPSAAVVRPLQTGFIRVSREPGGRLGSWTRTALLYRDSACGDLLAQLHVARLEAWNGDGVYLAGDERVWRRKDCETYQRVWQLAFREMSRVAVFRLRECGVRLPLDQVRTSPPLRGRVLVDGSRATLLEPANLVRYELAKVQIQRWDAKGIVLAGVEAGEDGARAWQAWFVTFPDAAPAVNSRPRAAPALA